MNVSLKTFPTVIDPAIADPRQVHVRSTMWGCGWPADAPAFCGTRPCSHWHIVNSQPTCEECMALSAPPRTGFRGGVIALANGLMLIL